MSKRFRSTVEIGRVGWEPGVGSIKVDIDHSATVTDDLDAITSRTFEAVILQLGERDPLRLSSKQAEELAVLLTKATQYVIETGYFDEGEGELSDD